MKRNKYSRESGFNLLEVAIALAIVLIGLLGLHAMTLVVVNTSGVSEHISVATQLAQNKLENIKEAGYVSATASNHVAESYDSITGFANYSRTVRIIEDTPLIGTKTVEVQVDWRGDLDGSTKQVLVATILREE